MYQLLFQFMTLWASTLTYVLHPNNLWKICVFIMRKTMLYTLFWNISVAALLKYYIDYIPNMNQSVTLPFKQVNEELKYYGFAFDRSYKLDVCESDEILQINFPNKETLKFDRQLICSVIVHEDDNEIEFEKEFYQIWLRIKIKDQEASASLKHLAIKSFLVYNDESKNVKFQTYMKLGDFYYKEWFKALPIRVIIKFYDKFMTFLDLRESVDREGEVQLFSNIPINENNSTIRMMILQISSTKEISAIGELSLSPQLKGFRYFIYFHFWTSIIAGSLTLMIIFILLWEVLLNIHVWRFFIRMIKESLDIWK